jgi:hypothetical protein
LGNQSFLARVMQNGTHSPRQPSRDIRALINDNTSNSLGAVAALDPCFLLINNEMLFGGDVSQTG